jgi:hypothetical protein
MSKRQFSSRTITVSARRRLSTEADATDRLNNPNP